MDWHKPTPLHLRKVFTKLTRFLHTSAGISMQPSLARLITQMTKGKEWMQPLLCSFFLAVWALFSHNKPQFSSRASAMYGETLKRHTRFQLLYCGMNINHLRCSTFLQLARSHVQCECFWFSLRHLWRWCFHFPFALPFCEPMHIHMGTSWLHKTHAQAHICMHREGKRNCVQNM